MAGPKILHVIGRRDGTAAASALESGEDPCFGRFYSASDDECAQCTAALVMEDRTLRVCRSLCRERTRGRKPTSLLHVNLRTEDVSRRLDVGRTAEEVLGEMVGPDDSREARRAARDVLRRRFRVLRDRGREVPPIPPL